MNLSRKTIALIVGIVLIVMGVCVLIDLLSIHKNILALVVAASGAMVIRESR